jgi:hypothetical protein
MKIRTLTFLLAILAVSTSALAADAYFVRFNATGRQTTAGGSILWLDDILFYNTTSAPMSVRFLGVSNGSAQNNPAPLVLPPQQTISVNAAQPVTDKWLPVPRVSPLWVLHLDVPAGVIAESRDQYYVLFGIPELFPAPRGKVSMPIIRELVPAGSPQVHVGTDLGGNDARLNVGIYNASQEAATATIEIRRACDSTLVDSRVIVIAGNTLIQAGGLAIGTSVGCPAGTTEPWARNTLITVTQPSLTFVSTLNENIQSQTGEAGAIPIVGLAVTNNTRFWLFVSATIPSGISQQPDPPQDLDEPRVTADRSEARRDLDGDEQLARATFLAV